MALGILGVSALFLSLPILAFGEVPPAGGGDASASEGGDFSASPLCNSVAFFFREDPREYLAEAGLLQQRPSAGAKFGDLGNNGFDVRDEHAHIAVAEERWESIAEGAYPWKFESKKQTTVPLKAVTDYPCAVYAAESSIPGAGLGVYTAAGLRPRSTDTLGHPELVLVLVDYIHNPSSEGSLLSSYTWGTRGLLENGNFEAETVQFIVPGVGTMMNSHLGLYLAMLSGPGHIERCTRPRRMDRSTDPGAGAVSEHAGVPIALLAAGSHQREIPAGSEIFTSYGVEWFQQRGYDIPSDNDYPEADRILKRFVANRPEDSSQWDNNWQMQRGEAVVSANEKVASLLPREGVEAVKAANLGSALYSLPKSLRSNDWLEANGHCMDNLYPGPSLIPQAGRGAFASRSFARNDVVVMSPVIPLRRSDLDVYKKDRSPTGTQQILLNHCFGRPNSSLLMFPYSSGITLINHGGKRMANARIQWSTSKYNKSEWLTDDLEGIMARKKTGFMIDVIATRDIALGEEVLLDYGEEWEEAWEEHLNGWKADIDALISLKDMSGDGRSILIRTVQEQQDDPYPSSVGTVCLYEVNMVTKTKLGGDRLLLWKPLTSVAYGWSPESWRPCDIVSRERSTGVSGEHAYTYTADMKNYHGIRTENSIAEYPHIVHAVPRFAIKFTYKPYWSNQHLKNAFRHSIGLPDGLYPAAWLDEALP